jgi:pimeloyl-ACP methyl ester carboxylesterase
MTAVDFLAVDGYRIEYRFTADGDDAAAAIVLLHEGLGSIAMWKDFPERLAATTGRRVLVYSRRGYGRSSALAEARRPDYLHDEARHCLPAVIERLGLPRPLLFGHSDGATIALILAAEQPASISGVIALAPHVMVEGITIAGLQRARAAYETAGLRARLAPYHDDVDGAFWGWNRIWLDPDFRDWNIEALLPAIRAPVLAIQGRDDEYATLEQIERIHRALPGTELLALADCGHSPHRDQPDAVLAATHSFVERSGPRPAAGRERADVSQT